MDLISIPVVLFERTKYWAPRFSQQKKIENGWQNISEHGEKTEKRILATKTRGTPAQFLFFWQKDALHSPDAHNDPFRDKFQCLTNLWLIFNLKITCS